MSERISIFGIEIDVLTRQAAVERIVSVLCAPGRSCHYVVTPNVDHIVKLNSSMAFQRAYADAQLILADGWPVVTASRWLGKPLPETVPGSDLVPDLFKYISDNGVSPLTVYLLGAGPGVAERAAQHIESQYSNVKVVGCYSPAFGFEKDAAECEAICQKIASSGAELLVIGLGAPKQELWVHQYATQLPVKMALCVGATIDFLAGEKSRCPQWIRSIRLEWLHRMLSEPKRLAKRYANDAIVFPLLLIKEVLNKK